MKTTKLLPVVCTISLFLIGCDRPERTVDHLRKEIMEFRASPDDQKSAAIEMNLAKLDAQILKLRAQESTDKVNFLEEQRDSLASDFEAAKVRPTLQDAKSAPKGIQNVIQKTEKTGESLKEELPGASPHDAVHETGENMEEKAPESSPPSIPEVSPTP